MTNAAQWIAIHNSPSAHPAPPLPSHQSIANISKLLLAQAQKEDRDQKYASVKNVLSLLGAGAAISAVVLAPKSAVVFKELLKESPDWDSWKHFNASYLQRTLKRLHKLQSIEVSEKDGKQIICLTVQGKRKILRYSIDKLSIESPKHWDRKWRLVLYDVPKNDKSLGDAIRRTLHNLGFYPIQESVYVYPYSCFTQIEFLRQYYGLGSNVQYMVVEKIEDDAAYKTYFNLV